jgi:3-oxoacyl-[acyl-carrier-protein] synthase III
MGMHKKYPLVGVKKWALTFTQWARGVVVLFGDGAGAAFCKPTW